MKYHIITLGCQMNKNDSERIAAFLEKNSAKESSLQDADIVIVNACSVRKSATDKIHGKMKDIKGKTKILTGCVLEKERRKLEKHFHYVLSTKDLTSWPLPFLKKEEEKFFDIKPKRKGYCAYIAIMTGCDNFCSYCAVPYTKGRERSRDFKEILKEAKEAVEEGHKEIWLLGQNVNSYKGGVSFSELLRKVNDIPGDFWIRFTSSHPKDFSEDLIKTIKECDKVTEYLNLPVQSGDDKILKAMNRPYTVKQYKDIVNMVRDSIPEIVISTDIIVGFPGEKESQFRNTAKLFNEAQFEMAYISCYSPRPGTAAEKLEDNISCEEKKRRERVLTEILKETVLQKNKKQEGRDLRVLVTEKNKGRTRGHKTVLFEGPSNLIGSFVDIKITEASPWGLKGELL